MPQPIRIPHVVIPCLSSLAEVQLHELDLFLHHIEKVMGVIIH